MSKRAFPGVLIAWTVAFSCLAGIAWAAEKPSATKAKPTATATVRAEPFFPFCIDWHDAKKRTFPQQAEMLKELGYDGVGHIWLDKVEERIKSLDAVGLKLFQITMTVNIAANKPPYDKNRFKEVLALVKGRNVQFLLIFDGARPGDNAADEHGVAVIREMSDLARESGSQLLLYPHTGNWIQRIEEAVRIADKVDRPNVGVMFNLCHWLRVDKSRDYKPLLQQAMPRLWAVSINGADVYDDKPDWNRYIQPLDAGNFDVATFLKTLRGLGYKGPVGLQCYGIGGDVREHLARSIAAWRKMSGTPQAAEGLKIEFDEKGLASIVHNGVVLVNPADGRFVLQGVAFTDLREKSGVRRMWQPKPTKSAFDAATKTLLQEYDWGKVACVFAANQNRLDLRITLTNASAQPIQGCTVCPLRMILPNRYFNRFVSYYQEGDQSLPCHIYTHEKGSVALIDPDHGTGSTALFCDRGGKFKSVSLCLSGPTEERAPHHPIVDDVYFPKTGRLLAPGQTGAYRLSLVFGPPDAKNEALSAQTDAEYAKAHAMTLNWPDRRPIATVFLCNSAWGLPRNPRGWFQGSKDVDVTTPEGLEKFGAKLMAYADNCVARMKKMNAQGVIVWDIGGEEMPHAISYIGDPRTLPKTAPEMDRFADALMKKFSDAGFKLGVTIRPTEVYQPGVAGKLAWDHRLVRDPVALMSAKIEYARKRWGCTIFYLDSNVFGNDMMSEAQRKELRFIPWIMPITMLGKLAALHPDCLIIPEWSEKIDYTCSAPYSSANLGQGGTPADIRRIWPAAFRVVSVKLPLLEDRWQSYAESVEKGDVLLFPAWFDAQENSIVQILYRGAALRKSDTFKMLATAGIETLLKKAADPDEGTRYAAASALGASEKPEAIPALTVLLQDGSPLVRKQALWALAQMPKIDDPACIAALTGWLKPAKDPLQNALRAFTADALARAGDAAVPAILDLLAADKPQNRPAWSYAIRALGRSGATDPRAGAVLLGFLDATPAKAEFRQRAIEALGLLKVKDAVPVLVKILKKRERESEEERKSAVIALGRIGDPSAVGPLMEQFDAGYTTVVVYWIKGGIEEALRALTGEQEIVGMFEWKDWFAKQRAAGKGVKQARE